MPHTVSGRCSSRSRRGWLLGTGDGVPLKSARSARPLVAVPGLPPPRASGALGTGDRMVQQGGSPARPRTWYLLLVDLAAANAWAGHDKEAKEAMRRNCEKSIPALTVQTWVVGSHKRHTDPTSIHCNTRVSQRVFPQGGATRTVSAISCLDRRHALTCLRRLPVTAPADPKRSVSRYTAATPIE